ncbi:mitochondrial 37S ribosomal protein uS10m [Kwoniella pini CBS 10737]|uniref:Small ribosomal subunit protein uS10m n=1 Tax=Kwoniella pini CBS 10737 TaxID=1296096 RepID=A0A1B9I1C1_9TREE|nr:ribosomal protein S10 [Kwoniella pini CBS 10737]OCF49258.1 ribosomal protein S10 [Kwoniella pini CBS 10737]
MALPSARSALAAFSRPCISNAVASSSRYLSTSTMRSASTSATTTISEDAETALPIPFPKINKYLSFPKITPHKPKYGIHVATIHLQSYQSYNLDLTTQFTIHSANSLNISTSLPAFLPKEKSLYTVLKSPFVKKKSQENFERITYKRAIKIFDSSKESLDLFLRYLRQNSLPGVGIKVYLHEYVQVGFGKKAQQELGQQQQQDQQLLSDKKIQDAAQDLVKALSAESEQMESAAAVSDGKNENVEMAGKEAEKEEKEKV